MKSQSDKPGRKMYNSGDFDDYDYDDKLINPSKMTTLKALHNELLAVNAKIVLFRGEVKLKEHRSAPSLRIVRKALAKANKRKKQLMITIELHPDSNLPLERLV